jgi:hypothetical protein
MIRERPRAEVEQKETCRTALTNREERGACQPLVVFEDIEAVMLLRRKRRETDAVGEPPGGNAGEPRVDVGDHTFRCLQVRGDALFAAEPLPSDFIRKFDVLIEPVGETIECLFINVLKQIMHGLLN